VKIAVVTACGILANAGLGSARSINEFTSQGQNAKGRNLLAHIEQEELRHLGRGLRADGDTYSYGEYDGYRSWGGICQQGDKIPQSPIDIPDDKVREANSKPTSAMHFNYSKLVGATAVNTGHGVQVNMPKDNILTIGDQKWQLLQYHFHSPSEHALEDGKHQWKSILYTATWIVVTLQLLVYFWMHLSNLGSQASALP